jgi:hypothetical protein
LALIDPLMRFFNTGGANRKRPTGNSANGISQNCLTFGKVLFVKPLTTPIVVSTNSGSRSVKLGKVKTRRLMETKRPIYSSGKIRTS